jgi:hypothetical protein
MSTLTDEIKAFIVTGLARYDTPSEVAESVGVNFGVKITRQQVHAYDPACSKLPAPRWRELHAATRRAFLAEAAEIGIAHKAFRLRMLDRMARRALASNYMELTASFLEQAAKECGGLYDSCRRKDGERAITAPAPPAPESPSAAAPAAR